jgi:hypothetical protein
MQTFIDKAEIGATVTVLLNAYPTHTTTFTPAQGN